MSTGFAIELRPFVNKLMKSYVSPRSMSFISYCLASECSGNYIANKALRITPRMR